jgi:hypothetical protein
MGINTSNYSLRRNPPVKTGTDERQQGPAGPALAALSNNTGVML